MDTNPNPTGSEMMQRSMRMHDMVKVILVNFPQTRGDHLLLWITVLRKFYWKIVTVTTKPTLKMEWVSYDAAFLTPSPEGARRRCQEIQSSERTRLWDIVAEHHPDLVIWAASNADSDGKIDPLAWRENEQCKKEFMKLARTSELLPTERVIRKRMRNQAAHISNYGLGQMSVLDNYSRD